MTTPLHQPVGPLMSLGSSTASLGLRVEADGSTRPVVLVWAPPELLADPREARRLEAETARAAALEHPHITRVFGLAQMVEGTARVVEFSDGETLRGVLAAAGRLPPHFAARVVADAAAGVHYAHVAGNDDGSPLVHGDLRPETVMVGFAGAAKVSGYGALAVAPRERGGKRVPGRRSYLAPEQVRDGRGAGTVATDVFLLGLVLYECIAGERPFHGSPDLEVAAAIEPLPSLRPFGASAALDAVVQRATAKKPESRYRSALELKEALEAAVDGLPAPAALAAYLLNLFPDELPPHLARRHALAVARSATGEPEAPRPAPHAAPAEQASSLVSVEQSWAAAFGGQDALWRP